VRSERASADTLVRSPSPPEGVPASAPRRVPISRESEPSEDEWARFDVAFPARLRARVRLALVYLRERPSLAVGLLLLAGFVVLALASTLRFGPSLSSLPVNPAWSTSYVSPGPSPQHPFGIMRGLGVDVFSALVRATPWDLALLGGILLLSVGAGMLLGAFAGLVAGPSDIAVTAAADLVVGVPPFFLVMVLFLGVQPLVSARDGLLVFGLLFAFVLWPYYARPVRARAQEVAHEPYVEAARAAGAPRRRLLIRHVIPNSAFPVLAQLPVDVFNVFFVLTVFPFIACFGGGSGRFFQLLSPLPGPTFPEWGNLLANGACYGWSVLPQLNAWWTYVFPGATVALFGFAVALTCDGLLSRRVRERGP
jgi:peptide/nickel transport system permease protein